MLQQIGEWYSATDLKADDSKLIARRSAADKLVAAWAKADEATLLDVVAYALEVLAPLGVSSNPAAAVVCAAITVEQPSFSPERDGATLDPRICALVALSELISRRLVKPAKWRRREIEVVIAEALMSALRFREFNAGDFLGQRIAELFQAAQQLLHSMDESRRQRRGDPYAVLTDVKTKTEATAIRDDLVTALSTIFRDILLDREEIQALWWVFGGIAQTSGKPFEAMSAPDAAVLAGYELSEITSWPGTDGIGVLAGRVAKAAKGSEAPIDLSTLSSEVATTVLPSGRRARAERWPIVFPLSSAILNGVSKGPILKPDLIGPDIALQAYTEASLLGLLR